MDHAKEFKKQGNEKYKEGKCEEAKQLYSDAIDLLSTDNAYSTCNNADIDRLKSECLCNRSLVTLLVAKNANGENVPESTKALVQTLFQKALDDADKATKLDPTYAKAYLRKAAAYEELGRKGDARAARASAKRREINAQLENRTPSIPLVEDNVRFTDLASGQDPLDLVSKPGARKEEHYELGGGKRISYLVMDLKTMEKARNRQLRRGKIKLFYALSMRFTVSYLNSVIDTMEMKIGAPEYDSDPVQRREFDAVAPSLKSNLFEAEDSFRIACEDAYNRKELALATRFFSVCIPLFARAYALLKDTMTEGNWLSLGSLYCNFGLVHRNASNAQGAIENFEKSAEYGNGDAMVEVGLIYVYGLCGVTKCEQNLEKAKKYLTMALTAVGQPCDYRKNQIREGLVALNTLSYNPEAVIVRQHARDGGSIDESLGGQDAVKVSTWEDALEEAMKKKLATT